MHRPQQPYVAPVTQLVSGKLIKNLSGKAFIVEITPLSSAEEKRHFLLLKRNPTN